MNWESEEEKKFKIGYVESYDLTNGKMLSIIASRKADLEKWLKDGSITKENCDIMFDDLNKKEKWTKEVEDEMNKVSLEDTVNSAEVSIEDIKEYLDPNKVRDKLKDIRDERK